MKLSSLKPGMTVWSVRKHLMGNTTIKTISVYEVNIIEVNHDEGWFTYSWNGNSVQKGHDHTASQFKKNKPVTIRCSMGYRRLATRAEIQEMKRDHITTEG